MNKISGNFRFLKDNDIFKSFYNSCVEAEKSIYTYGIFDLESGVPTFACELEKDVEDGYLVEYKILEVKSKIMELGINYDDLSAEDKEQFEDTFDDDIKISSKRNSNYLLYKL